MKRVMAVIVSFVMALVLPASTYAISEAQLDFFAQNNILFYDPNGSGSCLMAGVLGDSIESDGSDVYMLGDTSIIAKNELQDKIKEKFPKIQLNITSDIVGTLSNTEILQEAEKRGIFVIAFGSDAGLVDLKPLILNGLAGRDLKVVLVTAYKEVIIDAHGKLQELELNNKIRELAQNNENISMVDFAASIMAAEEKLAYYAYGIGLTPLGKDLYVNLLADAVNGLTQMKGDVESVSGLAQINIDFIEKYHEIAASLSIQYGIPWETVVAQGILESASGTSRFAVERNNFFGIAAYDSNTDAAYSYETPELGWKGYYDNIVVTSVYRNNGVFQGATVTDPYEYLVAIKQAGYATSPTYVQNVAPIIKSIEEYSRKKGWASSAQLAAAYPKWYENAERNAQGVTVTSTGGGYSGYFCDLESSNGTYPPTIIGESDKPITGVKFTEMANVACDSRTYDMGIFDGYRNGKQVKVRLCKLNKPGYQITCNSPECLGKYGFPTTGGKFVSVNSVVSGAFAALAHQYYIENGEAIEGANGFRSNEYQKYLYHCYKSKECNNGNEASAAGYSPHQAGFAVDFETGCASRTPKPNPGECGTEMDRWLSKYAGRYINDVGMFGLTRNVSGEAWHVQMPTKEIDKMQQL